MIRREIDSNRYLTRYPEVFCYGKSDIYHYTNLEGLLGILSNRGFWLSDARFLNDGEELVNGARLSIQLIERVKRKRTYRQFVEVLNIVLNKLSSEEFKACYVCSFSIKGDMLEQWRAYSQNGHGVSIGFSFERRTDYPHFNLGPQYFTQKVIYKDEIKNWIVLSIIRAYKLSFNKECAVNDDLIEDYASSLFTRLSMLFANFKHESFHSEQEVRLIDNSGKESFYQEKYHRVSQGMIVPYFASYKTKLHAGNDIPIKPDNLPVSEIILGPNSNHKELSKSIEAFLMNLGYSRDIVIRRSEVPYRAQFT